MPWPRSFARASRRRSRRRCSRESARGCCRSSGASPTGSTRVRSASRTPAPSRTTPPPSRCISRAPERPRATRGTNRDGPSRESFGLERCLHRRPRREPLVVRRQAVQKFSLHGALPRAKHVEQVAIGHAELPAEDVLLGPDEVRGVSETRRELFLRGLLVFV